MSRWKIGLPRNPQKIVLFLLAVLSPAALAYARTARSETEFVAWSLAIIAIRATLIVLGFVYMVVKSWRGESSGFWQWVAVLWFLGFFSVCLVGASVIGIVAYSVFVVVSDGFRWWLSLRFQGPVAVTMAAAVTLVAGIGLYLFRQKFRSTYGVTETCVGLVVAGQRGASGVVAANDLGFYFALLTAGVYLVVRGIDNIYQGWTSDSRDPLAEWAVRRVQEYLRSSMKPPST